MHLAKCLSKWVLPHLNHWCKIIQVFVMSLLNLTAQAYADGRVGGPEMSNCTLISTTDTPRDCRIGAVDLLGNG